MVGTYYNKTKFELVDYSEDGCFISKPKKTGPVLTDSGSVLTDSGSGFSCILLLDKRTFRRVFVLNIHVTILEDFRLDSTYSLQSISTEIDRFVLPFCDKHKIDTTDFIIIGGDINGGKILMPKPEVDTYSKKYNEFVAELLKSKLQEKIGGIIEVGGERITHINCATDTQLHLDHIFSNIPEITEITGVDYNSHLDQMPLLRNRCSNDDDLPVVHLRNREYNRNLRIKDLDLSDHRPVIATLVYKDYSIIGDIYKRKYLI